MCHLAFARRLVKRNAGRCNRTPRLQVDAGCPVTARDIKHKTIETGSAGLLVLACFLSLSVASGCASKEGTVTREGRDAHVVEIGPEQIVLTDGLQVYMFQTSKGTLVAMAQLSLPPGYQLPERNVFPSIPGWIISRNQGKSWQRWSPKGVVPSSAYEPVAPGPRFEGTATELKDGTVMLLEWIADGPLPDGNWTGSLWESRDDCGTLQGPIPVTVHLPQAKTGYDDSGRPGSSICFHRPLVELPGGDLITPVYCLFKGDNTPVAYQPTMLKMRCVLLRSADRGRSWGYLSTIAVNPAVGQEGFDEPVMIRLSAGPKAGRLICVMRTGRDTHLYQTHSDDDGATWSEPHSIGLFGVDPDMIELSDGALVCGFLWRTGGDSFNPRAPVYLAVSKDQGDTWEDLIKFPQGQDPRFRRWSEYGGIREIAPGRLIVLYDVIPDGWTGTVRYVASREIRLPAPGDWRADASLEKNVLPTVGRKTMRVRRATAPLSLTACWPKLTGPRPTRGSSLRSAWAGSKRRRSSGCCTTTRISMSPSSAWNRSSRSWRVLSGRTDAMATCMPRTAWRSSPTRWGMGTGIITSSAVPCPIPLLTERLGCALARRTRSPARKMPRGTATGVTWGGWTARRSAGPWRWPFLSKRSASRLRRKARGGR